MDPYLKRAWAQINLDTIEHNYNAIRKHLSNKARIMCVVKADAYGHGATVLAREYERLGADFFGVSNLEEAIQLRDSGVSLPILILGYTPAHLVSLLSKHDISQTVVSQEHAQRLSFYAGEEGVKIRVHVKVDTGMNRLGILATNRSEMDSAVRSITQIGKLENLFIEGMFTHFAVSDSGPDGEDFTRTQYKRFATLRDRVKNSRLDIPLCHCCNSGAVLDYPEFALDMVRPGIVLYGLYPSESIRQRIDLQPAMELKTVVSLVKSIEEGGTVSYGRTFRTSGKTTVATVPIGYADGYKRSLSSNAYMSVHGRKVPVIGRVCMDQTMLDVSAVESVKEGDVVTVFGKDKYNRITVDKLAGFSNTINYEFVCLIGRRVPRIYYKGGKVVKTLNYICPTDHNR